MISSKAGAYMMIRLDTGEACEVAGVDSGGKGINLVDEANTN